MWLAHCCPIRGVFCFQEGIPCIMISLLPRISINFQKRKVAFCTFWEKTRLYCLVWNSNIELKTSFSRLFYAKLKARLPFIFYFLFWKTAWDASPKVKMLIPIPKSSSFRLIRRIRFNWTILCQKKNFPQTSLISC